MAAILIGLGALCAAYGMFIMLAWSGTPFFVVWYALGALFAGIGTLLHRGTWGQLPTALRVGAPALGAVAAAMLAVALGLIVTQSHAPAPADLDALVVLGAQVRADKTPTPVLQYRLDTAASYLRQNDRTMCIVSGGQGFNEPCTEAQAMAAYLVAAGIDPNRIVLEDRSANTVENIALSKRLLPSSRASVGIVTNDFHCYRAGRIAKAQGLERSCTIAARSNPANFPNNALRECMGIIKDKLTGHI